MKFKTTKDHPFCKEGMIVEEDGMWNHFFLGIPEYNQSWFKPVDGRENRLTFCAPPGHTLIRCKISDDQTEVDCFSIDSNI